MKLIALCAMRFGNWMVLWGMRRARADGALEIATGDHLTALGALYEIKRETDDEFRARFLAAIRGRP